MMSEHETSLYDEIAATTEGMLGLAAADLASCGLELMHRAKKLSGKTSKELADLLSVTEGRVSQVLNGDGNVHIATLARFVRAMGFEVVLDLRHSDAQWGGTDDESTDLDVYVQPFATDLGITEVTYYVETAGFGSFPTGWPQKKETLKRKSTVRDEVSRTTHFTSAYTSLTESGGWSQLQEAT